MIEIFKNQLLSGAKFVLELLVTYLISVTFK